MYGGGITFWPLFNIGVRVQQSMQTEGTTVYSFTAGIHMNRLHQVQGTTLLHTDSMLQVPKVLAIIFAGAALVSQFIDVSTDTTWLKSASFNTVIGFVLACLIELFLYLDMKRCVGSLMCACCGCATNISPPHHSLTSYRRCLIHLWVR